MKTFQACRHSLDTLVVESHAVDQRVLLGVTVETGLGVSRLCKSGDRAYFNKPKSKRLPSRKRNGILIHPSSKSERIRKLNSGHGAGKRWYSCSCHQFYERWHLSTDLQYSQHKFMNLFRIQGEKERSEKRGVEIH